MKRKREEIKLRGNSGRQKTFPVLKVALQCPLLQGNALGSEGGKAIGSGWVFL
jgi:hypothetical protein